MKSDQAMPLCYSCKHRSSVPGDSHSSCHHPKTAASHDDPLAGLLAIFASVGRVEPVISPVALQLGIEADLHGIRRGWFNWPWNFDPVWLRECNGYEKREG